MTNSQLLDKLSRDKTAVYVTMWQSAAKRDNHAAAIAYIENGRIISVGHCYDCEYRVIANHCYISFDAANVVEIIGSNQNIIHLIKGAK